MTDTIASLKARYAGIDADSLPLPTHITTPMGRWSFFSEEDLVEAKKEGTHSFSYDVPDGMTVTRFRDLTLEDLAIVKERLMMLVQPNDRLAARHLKELSDGILIRIDRPLFKPLFLKHMLAGNTAFHTLILLAPGSQARIVEEFTGEGNASHVTEVFLEENSHLVHATVQEVAGTFISRKASSVARDATIDWFEIAANNGLTFSRIRASLNGEHAAANIATAYLGNGDSRMDVGARADHHTPMGSSSLLTKGVLADEAKAIYEGTLAIGRDAAKSKAFQQEHGLLLGKDAEVKASPVLYIDNNDVTCSHAATTRRPDAERLFYLMTRGLAERDARKLLVNSFLWPVVEAVPEYTRELIVPVAERAFERFVNKEAHHG